MTRGKLGFIISSVLVLIATAIIPIFMNNDFGGGELACYIIAKVLMGCALIVAIIYTLLSPSFNGSKGSILILAAVLQFVPLGLRYILLSSSGSKFIWYTVIFTIALVAFVSVSFGLSEQNKKMLERDEAAKGVEIEVKEEKRLATDNKED